MPLCLIASLRRSHILVGLWVAVRAAAAPAEIVVQQGPSVEVSAAVYSPDGRLVASGGESESIRLWDRFSGDLVRTLPGHRERVVGLAFSPAGGLIASSSTDGVVQVWDYSRGILVHRFTNHVGNWVRRIAFSPDGLWLVPAAYDGTLSVWDVTRGVVARTIQTQARIADVLFTPDGNSIVTASREDKEPLIRFWDRSTGLPTLTLNPSNSLHSIAISKNGRLLASGGGKGLVNLWEMPSGRWLRAVQLPEPSSVSDVDLSSDGKRLAAAGQWKNTLWETGSGKLLFEMSGHQDATIQISFSPDDREIASGSSDASVALWDAKTGKRLREFAARPPNTPITSIAFSPDGAWEAVGSVDGTVRVWEAATGRFKYQLRGHEGPVHALEFSLDSAWLFSGGADRTMRVWDMAHGTVSAHHPYFSRVDAMGAIAAGGAEGYVATAVGPYAGPSLGRNIVIWQSHYDRPIRILSGHAASVRALAFARGIDLLASSSTDGSLKLWDSRKAICLETLSDSVSADAIVFTPDAQWLVAGLGNGTVRVLGTNGLSVAREWPAHSRPVQTLAMGSGRWLATASADQTVAIWDFATARELYRFTNVTSHYLPVAFHPTRPVVAFARKDEMIVHADVETGEILFQRVLFPDGEWLAWNPANAFYTSSPRGHDHARLRLAGQLYPVYPLELYQSELRRDEHLLAALAGPAPALAPKNFRLWWHRYPYKRAWLYGGLALTLFWVAARLRRGWISERKRRAQENISRQLLESQEAERKRIAAELHDSLGQNLLIIKNRLYLAQQSGDGTAAELEEISKTVSQTIEEVREISHNLRPYQLDRLGLTKAVESVVKKVVDSGALAIRSNVGSIDGLFPPEGEINFYRIVQESLTNILKHSHAATAHITIEHSDGRVRMLIQDDGKGFEYRRDSGESQPGRGFGLTGLNERVRILGGRFRCESAPGDGTRLTFEIPVLARNEKGNHNSHGG